MVIRTVWRWIYRRELEPLLCGVSLPARRAELENFVGWHYGNGRSLKIVGRFEEIYVFLIILLSCPRIMLAPPAELVGPI